MASIGFAKTTQTLGYGRAGLRAVPLEPMEDTAARGKGGGAQKPMSKYGGGGGGGGYGEASALIHRLASQSLTLALFRRLTPISPIFAKDEGQRVNAKKSKGQRLSNVFVSLDIQSFSL